VALASWVTHKVTNSSDARPPRGVGRHQRRSLRPRPRRWPRGRKAGRQKQLRQRPRRRPRD
jgi:hypothetical protein